MQIIWNINGIILLLVFVVGIFILTIYVVIELNANSYEYNKGVVIDESKDKAKSIGFDLQHLLYDRPKKIPFSDYYYSPIYVIDKEIPEKATDIIKRANDVSMDLFGGTINILFIKKNSEKVYPLLKRFGYITTLDIPHAYNVANIPEDERRKWILYKIATDDTNGDGRINKKDDSAFYLSDLSGKNLRKITPDDIRLNYYWIDRDDDLIYFENIIKHGDKDQFGFLLKTRTMYIFDIAKNKFYKFDKLQSTFDSLQNEFKSN